MQEDDHEEDTADNGGTEDDEDLLDTETHSTKQVLSAVVKVWTPC